VIQLAHIGIALLCAFASLSKNVLVWRGPLGPQQIVQIRLFDKVSATAAGLLVLTGIAMVVWLAKPSAYYLSSPIFWAKMGLFTVASALVVWTKVDFRAAAASGQAWTPPARVRAILAFDFVGLFALMVLGRWIAVGADAVLS
jgi:uncharacterized membrane protein